MKRLAPAAVRPEPAALAGLTFLEAAGGGGVVGRCLWPLAGAGAEMVVCGDERAPGDAYCAAHRRLAHPPGAATP
jgi:hypothetical protein